LKKTGTADKDERCSSRFQHQSIHHKRPFSFKETKTPDRRICLLIYRLIIGHAMTFKPTDVQQLAIQAKLNMRLGSQVYDSVFTGMQIGGVLQGVMQVWVRSEYCANIIEKNYLGTLAVIAESVLKKPVRSVTVVPRNVRDWTEQ